MAKEDYVERYRREYTSPSDKPLERIDNKFGVDIVQYPSDLQSVDLKHYVLFNINVRGKSEADPQSKRLFEVKRDPNGGGFDTDELSTATTAGAAASAAVAAGVAITSLVGNAAKAVNKTGAASKVVTRSQSFAKKAAPYAAGALGGLIAGSAAAATVSYNDILKKDKSERITDAIALYVDGPPTVKYSMNYANKELGTLLGLLTGAVTGSVGAGEGIAAMGATVAKLPGAFGGGDLAAAQSKSSGTSLNPFREVVFESVDFRSFTFKYKFLPKSKKESEDVRNIVTLFKEHMHPQLSAGKLFFIYPSEFQITYYYENDENTYFHRFRPCALESLDVSYGGEQFSSFKDGNPTEVNLTMTFRELEILTRQMIRDGY
jgi:hypothetical protein